MGCGVVVVDYNTWKKVIFTCCLLLVSLLLLVGDRSLFHGAAAAARARDVSHRLRVILTSSSLLSNRVFTNLDDHFVTPRSDDCSRVFRPAKACLLS